MKLSIVIDCDGAAFEDAGGAEAARILRGVADWLEAHGDGTKALIDANGNRCGVAEVGPRPAVVAALEDLAGWWADGDVRYVVCHDKGEQAEYHRIARLAADALKGGRQ